MKKNITTTCLFISFSLLLYSLVLAEQKAYKLIPKTIPELDNGKIIFVGGTTDAQGDRFWLENLSILQPVSVTLLSESSDHNLKLILSKYRYDEPEKEGTTLGERRITFKIRTEGELLIEVKAPDDSLPYRLAVWTGDEVEPEMSSVVVSMSQYNKSQQKGVASNSSGNLVMWIIAFLLGGIIILLTMVVFRKKT